MTCCYLTYFISPFDGLDINHCICLFGSCVPILTCTYSGELAAMPDFAQVYNFLGNIFDPETSGHLQKLREMDPIDAETVCHLLISPV